MNYNLRLYNIFSSLMVTVMLVCDALSLKVVTIFGFNFSASGLIFPLSFFLACIVTEVYGYDLAGRIIWIQMLCQAFFILTVNLFVLLPSNTTQILTPFLYLNLYENFWRILIASSISVPLAYFTTDFVMSTLKIRGGGRFFLSRYIIANICGKLIIVSISYPINFHGQLSVNEIFYLCLNTFIYKMIIAFFIMPLAFFIARLVKNIEKLDFYDYGVSYNPVLVFNSSKKGKNLYSENINRSKK